MQSVRWLYFIYYLAQGSYFPFLPLYFQHIGMNGAEIGLLSAVTPAISLVAQPFWGNQSDAAMDRRRVLRIVQIGTIILFPLLGLTNQFGLLLVLAVLVATMQTALGPLNDGLTLSYLGSDRHRYGHFRAMGSLGFAVTALVMGLVYDQISLRFLFLVYPVLMGAAFYSTFRLPTPDPRRGSVPTMWHRLGAFRGRTAFWLFLALAIGIGAGNAASNSFFGIYVGAIDGPNWLVGIGWAIPALVEVPVFLLLSHMVQRYGTKTMLVGAFVAYAIRFFGYSMVRDPFAVMALQVVNGCGYVLFWGSAVMLVGELSPHGAVATGQALYTSLSVGIASILGNMLGGEVVYRVGVLAMYRDAAWFAVFTGILFVVLFVIGKTGSEYGNAVAGLELG